MKTPLECVDYLTDLIALARDTKSIENIFSYSWLKNENHNTYAIQVSDIEIIYNSIIQYIAIIPHRYYYNPIIYCIKNNFAGIKNIQNDFYLVEGPWWEYISETIITGLDLKLSKIENDIKKYKEEKERLNKAGLENDIILWKKEHNLKIFT
jgi:hypothetical protein